MKPFHVVLPTLKFETFYNNFFNSIKFFQEIKEYFSFGICFQNYTEQEIELIVKEFEKYDLDLKYIHKQYEQPIKMSIVRNDCARLNSEALYYLILDDDIWYEDGEIVISLLNSMIYLLTYPKCGVLAIKRMGPRNIQFCGLINILETCHGLFVKNIYPNGSICAEEYMDNIGGYNDIILSYPRLMTKEYYAAIGQCASAHHVESKPIKEIGFTKHK